MILSPMSPPRTSRAYPPGVGRQPTGMSLWLQSVLAYLAARDYAHVRGRLLPIAPIALPGCLERELAFAERRCASPDEADTADLQKAKGLERYEAEQHRGDRQKESRELGAVRDRFLCRQ